MQVVTKATLLLALLLRPAGAAPCPLSLNCLFGCCEALPPPSEPPACVADGTDGCVSDFGLVTLGVSFTTSKQICVTGVQFYHEAGGAFATSLWNKATLLDLRPSSATGSGWLLSTFTTPVLMSPGNTFVASYTASSGAYSYEYNYFDIDRTVGPVTFKGGANGVYVYNSSYPSHGPFRNSNYFVTPVWEPNWSYYVWNATSNTERFEIYDGFTGCIIGTHYNIEARPSCPTPSVAFKLSNLGTGKVVKRQTETVAPFFLFGDNVTIADVFPSLLNLTDGLYQLSTTVGNNTEIIKFTQDCF